MICLMEDHSTNISVKLLSKYLQLDSNNFHVSHCSMESLSFHSYKVSNGNKQNALFVKTNVRNNSAKFQLYPDTASEELIF